MIPASIQAKIGRNLHSQPDHPIRIVKQKIYDRLGDFKKFDSIQPEVAVADNFDALLIPQDHPSRSKSDTFYINEEKVLRTHTSAHQKDLLTRGYRKFLVTGDCYRRDAIDRFHYPVFHQMEGVSICDGDVEKDLHETLNGIVNAVFGKVESRFVNAYFPFTEPSWEMEIRLDDKWVEVLGCGCIQNKILEGTRFHERGRFGEPDKLEPGWAFGLGLERLAMILFKIPDIRYFWSEDPRFLEQFKAGRINEFVPYSNQPSCYKDISFWVSPTYNENEFFEVVREKGQDLIEEITLLDRYEKGDKRSFCYRIVYRSVDRTLTNDEINELQKEISLAVAELGVEIRK